MWPGGDDPAAVVREGVGDGPLSDDIEKEEKNGEENGDVDPAGSSSNCGAILPMVQVAGTATRRAVEATWLTASNPKVITVHYMYCVHYFNIKLLAATNVRIYLQLNQ